METILRILFVLILWVPALHMAAQVPQKMNYQAVARDASGNPISNRVIAIKFTVREATASGPDLFAETMTAITNVMGTFSVEIGGGTPILGSFSTIPWSTGAKYLNVKIDPNGGTSYTDMGTYQLLSVAYAQYAKNVLNNDDNDANPANELQTLSIAGNQLTISDGNTVTLPSGGGGTPGGSSGNVQFNNSGAFGGDNNLFWDNTAKKLGIGTTTPAAFTEIKGNSGTGFPHLMLTETESDYARMGFWNTAYPTKIWHVAGLGAAADADARFNVWYWNGTAGTDILSVTGTGRLNITGITESNHQVDILGGNSNTYLMWHNNSSTYADNRGLLAGLRNDGVGYLWNYESAPIHLGTSGVARMTIAADGKVGINNAAPTAMLDVSGTARLGSSGTAFSEIKEITGTTTTGNHVTISLPSGYTRENIRVLSLEINYTGSAWVGLGGSSSTTNPEKVFYYLDSSTIWIYYPNDATFQNRAYRMIIMKM